MLSDAATRCAACPDENQMLPYAMTPKMTLTAIYATANQKAKSNLPASSDRQALIELHLPQVRYIAERMLAKLPPSVDRQVR